MTDEEEESYFMKDVVSQAKRCQQRCKSCSFHDQMKTKNFYIGCAFLVATTVSLWIISNPTPNFNTIVTQTHKQISNIKNIPENIRNSNTEDFNVDPRTLQRLGFQVTVSVPEQHTLTTTKAPRKLKVKSLPIIATAALPGQFERLMGLIKSAAKYLPDKMVLIYNVGLDSGSIAKVSIIYL